MAITLITGVPGSGKTQFFIAKLFNELAPGVDRAIEIDGQIQERAVFENGVTGLDHQRFRVFHLDDPEKWFEVPVGSVVVIDECQRVFPQRMAGREVPPKCREFETHRHRGLDVYLITQDATLMDAHVRKLVNFHVHVDRLFNLPLAKVYTYPRYVQNPADQYVKKSEATSRKWFLYRKKYYKAYKSSEVHTVKKKVPIIFYFLPLLFGYIIWGVSDFMSDISPDENPDSLSPADNSGDSVGNPFYNPVLDVKNLPTKARRASSREEYLYQRTPLIPGVEWSAPMYEDLTSKVVTFPKPLCIVSALDTPDEKCSCLSQQGTRMEIPLLTCKAIAVNGLFDPTMNERTSRQKRGSADSAPALPASSGSVEYYRPMGGKEENPNQLRERLMRSSRDRRPELPGLK